MFVTGPVRNDPDLVTIFKKAGKGFGKLFASSIEKPADTSVSPDHGFTYGVVYANKLAAAVVDKSAKEFPVGSILIRERLDTRTATVPSAVIAMAKRDPGFSKDTGDWEFFMFDGKDMKLLLRQTVGNCATCHTRTRESDWVFLDHLKK